MNQECLGLVTKYGYANTSLEGMKLITIQALLELGKGLSLANTRKIFKIKKFLCPDCSQKNQPTALLLTHDKSLFCSNCTRTFSSKTIRTIQAEHKQQMVSKQ